MKMRLVAASLAALILAIAVGSVQAQQSKGPASKTEMYCSSAGDVRSVVEAHNAGMEVPAAMDTLNEAQGKRVCGFMTPVDPEKVADVETFECGGFRYVIQSWRITSIQVILNNVPMLIGIPSGSVKYKIFVDGLAPPKSTI